jgi:hypothetical protein
VAQAAQQLLIASASNNSHTSRRSNASNRSQRLRTVRGAAEAAGLAVTLDPCGRASATIRQHYYLEGGWGWVVVCCALIISVLVHGLQLSFGVLQLAVPAKFPGLGDLVFVYSGMSPTADLNFIRFPFSSSTWAQANRAGGRCRDPHIQ